jgi:hypothetical protein
MIHRTFFSRESYDHLKYITEDKRNVRVVGFGPFGGNILEEGALKHNYFELSSFQISTSVRVIFAS